MKKTGIFMALAGAALLSACGGADKKEVEHATLTSEVVGLEGDAVIGGPLSMTRVGKLLIVTDNKIDSMQHLIDLGARRYVGQIVQKGQGPGEFGNVSLTATYPGKSDRFLLSVPGQKAVYEAIADLGGDPLMKYNKLADIPDIWFVARLANGNFITSDGYVGWPEMFSIYAPDGKLLARTGDRRIPDEYKSYPPVETTAAYQYHVLVSPDGKHVAGIGDGDAASFFKVDGDSLLLAGSIGKHSDDHLFADNQYRGIKGEFPNGFLTSDCTDDLVYVLWSELAYGEESEEDAGRSFTGKIIKVYDWDGRQVTEYELDRRVKTFVAPDSDGVIYAITQDGCDPTLVAFPTR